MDIKETFNVTQEDLEEAETLHSGHCCNCKMEGSGWRLWVCRVGGGVTLEMNVNGVWKDIEGDCMTPLDHWG